MLNDLAEAMKALDGKKTILIMTHKMSSCMNSHCWLRPRIPVLCVCFGLVVVVFFVCLLVFGCFWFGFCLFGFLLGLLPGLRTGPLPALLWLSTS